ncbi:NADPH2:quinone reductase [Burkholderiales bacterium]|jgi:NADPH2:quinone reductase|nr:NADPH2:quinone reductase [Burkholderiales bacterium]
MMQVVEISAPGGPEVLRIGERPRPQPGPGEVLIEVVAAGVNRPDVLQRKGAYPPPPGASDIPGLEVAGKIVELGESVGTFAVGDHVCALVTGGGYAQFCLAPAPQCLPVPTGLTDIEAASLPETYFTVWSNVFDRVGLRPGESFLVQGGSSGIGVAAIQLANALGSRVFATAGSDEKCAACVRLGAQRAINYRSEDFVAVVKAETGGRGVDVILDMIGGDYLLRETAALAEDGRLVFINTMGGAKTTVNLHEVMVKRLTITGSTLRSRPVTVKAEIARRLQQRVWPLLEVGKVKPVIYRTFSFAEAAKAHALMESSEHVGKIVLLA